MSGGPLSPSRQVVFHQMLVAARRSVLNDALSEVLGQIDPDITKKQILAYVPSDAQRILAAAGIRDEHICVGINRREVVNERVIQRKE
jgi:hypothetical protein